MMDVVPKNREEFNKIILMKKNIEKFIVYSVQFTALVINIINCKQLTVNSRATERSEANG
jgi:hypothetical protein